MRRKNAKPFLIIIFYNTSIQKQQQLYQVFFITSNKRNTEQNERNMFIRATMNGFFNQEHI